MLPVPSEWLKIMNFFEVAAGQEIASESDTNEANRCSSCQVDNDLGSIEAFRPLGHSVSVGFGMDVYG